jgi:hypothetical protein
MNHLPDGLCPAPLMPRRDVERPSELAAQKYLERYRVLAMAMATRAIAMHWDTGLIAHRAEVTLVETHGGTGFPLEQEVLALIGVTRNRAPAHVQEAERGVLQALEDLTIEQVALAGVPPLEELAEDFHLGPMAKMLLVLIAAPQLWGAVHQLYRMAANDPGGPGVDEHLLSMLLGPQVNPHAVAHELRGASPLMASGLVRRDDRGGAAAFAQLRVSSLAVARLRGDLLLRDPERREPRPRPLEPLSGIALGAEAVAAIVEWSGGDPPGTPLVLRGRKASGRTTTLHALAAAARRRLEVIDLGQLPRGGVTTELAEALQRCHVAGWIPCVTGFDAITDERELRGGLGHALDQHPGPLTLRVGPDEQPPISPGYRLVELPPLSETQRQAMWKAELQRHQLPGQDHAVFASRWRVGPGTIRRVVAAAAAAPTGAGDLAGHIDRVTTQHLQNRLGDVAERVHELPCLSDMVLPSDILDSLTEFIARNRLGHRVYEEWGMARVAPTGRGLTALFQGAPGTGKTMVAGALARELGRDLYRVDLSRLLSKWIGETERNLANVFAAAEDGHAIILFDEADSLFTKRTEVKSSNDRHANLEVNYLLQRLDSFIGIAILTTNFGTAIDPAFKRRLSFRLTFPVPDEELREQLWRKLLPPQLPTGKLDLADLARKYHLAGGAIRNCVMRAAFLAAAEDQVLTQEYLLRAIRLEYRSVGKLSEGGPLE